MPFGISIQEVLFVAGIFLAGAAFLVFIRRIVLQTAKQFRSELRR